MPDNTFETEMTLLWKLKTIQDWLDGKPVGEDMSVFPHGSKLIREFLKHDHILAK
jgi:hypothetical protein